MIDSKGKKKVVAFVPNVLGFSPGQRVRIETWRETLENAGWELIFSPFEDPPLHDILYNGTSAAEKARGLWRCFRTQYQKIKDVSADAIFIYREASLVGPAIIERALARKGIPIIFDIDDPIWIPYKSPANNWASLLKFSRKTHSIFQLSTHVIAINHLIADHAKEFNSNVTVIPNCIDTERYFPIASEIRRQRPPKLVWIGSQSTMQNLLEIAAPIRRVQQQTEAPLLIIGSGSSEIDVDDVEVRQWSSQTEVADLQEGDIGLLPLNDLPWNNWKFFFKTIQYMAVGIPVVARRMGSNAEIIQNGFNGFLVENEQEWFEKLMMLIQDPDLRSRMGDNARRTIEERFSLNDLGRKVLEVFDNVLNRAKR